MIKLREGEKIILEVRRHPFVFYTGIIWIMIAALIPLIVFSIVRAYTEVIFGANDWLVFLFVYSLWIVILWMSLFYQWTDYYFDVWIITNERIVDIEQLGFFNRQVSTFQMDRIQDISVNTHGMIATLMKFGDLHVQTAGDHKSFVIYQAKDPIEVKESILRQIRETKLADL